MIFIINLLIINFKWKNTRAVLLAEITRKTTESGIATPEAIVFQGMDAAVRTGAIQIKAKARETQIGPQSIEARVVQPLSITKITYLRANVTPNTTTGRVLCKTSNHKRPRSK